MSKSIKIVMVAADGVALRNTAMRQDPRAAQSAARAAARANRQAKVYSESDAAGVAYIVGLTPTDA